jgi:lycopene beta-cyclase
MKPPNYDYIIAGAGCAGRSLAIRMLGEPALADKKILLVDNTRKVSNDRTWCFWEKENDIFEDIVSCRWSALSFSGTDGDKLLDIHPYKYKLIRSIDFYYYTDKMIAESKIEVIHGNVDSISNEDGCATAIIEGTKVSARYIFSSIPYELTTASCRYTYLLQHFKGWVIETDVTFFDPQKATLMDFYPGNQEQTAFFYTLPYTDKKALIEYTLFSDTILSHEQYEHALSDYIENRLGCKSYKITEVEDGCIPMYDQPFKQADKRIIYLGIAGGNAKASSGYTFRYIQKHTAAIVQLLAGGKYPAAVHNYPRRFRFYDSIFLRLLSGNKLSGKDIFSKLFAKTRPEQILKFLDNETSLGEEVKIFATLQKKIFAAEAIKFFLRNKK